MGDMKSFEGLGSGVDFSQDEFDGFDQFWMFEDEAEEEDDFDLDALIPHVSASVSATKAINEFKSVPSAYFNKFLRPETHDSASAVIDPWTSKQNDPWIKGDQGIIVELPPATRVSALFMFTSLSTFSPTSLSTPTLPTSPIS